MSRAHPLSSGSGVGEEPVGVKGLVSLEHEVDGTAELVTGGSEAFAGGGFLAFDEAAIGSEALDGVEAADVKDLIEEGEGQDFSDAEDGFSLVLVDEASRRPGQVVLMEGVLDVGHELAWVFETTQIAELGGQDHGGLGLEASEAADAINDGLVARREGEGPRCADRGRRGDGSRDAPRPDGESGTERPGDIPRPTR